MTIDIELPLDKPVNFPAVCMVCGKSDPNSAVDLTFFESSPPPAFEVVSTLAAGTSYSNPEQPHLMKGIPACEECGNRLKKHHQRQRIGNYGSWSLGLILAFALPVDLWIRIVVIVVFLTLPAIVSIANPPAFNVEFKPNKAEFQFASQTAANAFRESNMAGK